MVFLKLWVPLLYYHVDNYCFAYKLLLYQFLSVSAIVSRMPANALLSAVFDKSRARTVIGSLTFRRKETAGYFIATLVIGDASAAIASFFAAVCAGAVRFVFSSFAFHGKSSFG